MHILDALMQCPITGSPLTVLETDALKTLNRRIEAGDYRFLSGQPVIQPLEAALASEQSPYVYMIQDGIACMLPGLALIERALAADVPPHLLSATKKNVQDFYEQIGWQKADNGLYEDTVQFEETRDVARDYIRRCHERVKRHLQAGGTYLLDVASGPLPFPEHLEYSNGFEKRICVDLTFQALRAARQKLGDRGIYILGDITSLPLRDNAVDAAISLHTIYHVPKDEQAEAFHQLHRVLKPGRQAVVVYTWGQHSALMRMLLLPGKLVVKGPRKAWGFCKRLLGLQPPAKTDPNNLVLYYHPHDYAWLRRHLRQFRYQVRVWRSVNLDFLRYYIHDGLFGRALLRLVYRLEEAFPHFLGRYGQYPLLVISK